MKIKGISSALLFLFFMGFLSCDDNRVFDAYQTLEKGSWMRNDSVKFNFSISDTIHKHNLFIAVRNNQKYAFSNLFLISELNFPNGRKIVDTLEYAMADSRGSFLGTGFSSRLENKLFYKENQVFPTKGEYSVSILHAMRKSGQIEGIEALEGITDVGFRIEKVN